MSTPVAMTREHTAAELRVLANRTRDAGHARRLLAIAVIMDGGSRSEAARVGGVGLQTIRDWVLRYNADGPEGLATIKPPGRPSRLGQAHLDALKQWVEEGPMPAVDGVVRWRLVDLAQRLFEEFRITLSQPRLSRLLRSMGYRKLSARPRHHRQDPDAIGSFKKSSRPAWRRSGPGLPPAHP